MSPPPSSPLRLYIDRLPYASRLAPRDIGDIDLVVIHCTELPDIETARAYGERVLYAGSGTGNSGHWYIDRNGSALEYVPADRIAHHVRGYNTRSIGIELVNRGRFPDWLDSRRQQMQEPYPTAQVDALIALLAKLRRELPALRFIAGHEDLDKEQVPASDDPAVMVPRKRDPGPLFPWPRVVEACGLQRIP
ncbi:N-acetylmuramoyl-L-alanine amidase [Luteimonas aestuarii]|uniref:N-acetylmuramoyl-L-alanine amidase n=1 Tax=Luteimonas aestuarii TaxID=453837 RepID=A0A4R5TXQ1_9GAMM|nr:N-acetylmuramoyl-L-alanine amidase [Luteimonas aestuarii]TDK25955.1 N-acetylmuramoyl-L-alanine amidase [Luteimonas aestuarii]